MRAVLLSMVIALGVGIAVLVLAVPGLELARITMETVWSDAQFGERRLVLLLRGVRVALLAAGGSIVLGAGLAVGLAAPRRSRNQIAASWVALITLLTPPYVAAYAWSLTLLPTGLASGAPGALHGMEWVAHEGRAAWCLATWLAPVSATLLAAGWRLSGRAAYRLALIDARRGAAVWQGARPAVMPWIGLAFLAAFLLASTEYSVCHLCQVQTLSTEILAEFQTSPSSAAALACPLLALIGAVTVLLWLSRRRLDELAGDLGALRSVEEDVGGEPRAARVRGSIALTIACGALLAPWALMAAQVGDFAVFTRIGRTFPAAWPMGLVQAALAAAAAGVMAVAADAALSLADQLGGRARRTGVRCLVVSGVVLLVAAAILPPALIGAAFARAYAEASVIRDSVGIVAASNAARFSIIAVVMVRLASRTESGELSRAARVDGGGWADVYRSVSVPRMWRSLVGGCLAVGLLSLTEVAASTLITPPQVPSLALTLLNHVHFGRNDDVIALCLSVVAFTGAAGAGLFALRRR